MRLAGKRAIVTGGSRGIGEVIVRLFCQEGARVMISAFHEEPGTSLAKELAAGGADVFFHQTDVSNAASVEASIRAAVERFGGLDILVNNAGALEPDALVEDVPLEVWQNMLDVNLTGPFLNSKYALPHLRESKGCIVNTGSVSSLVSTQYAPSYCSSKAGLIGLTRSIAADYAQFGVRANAVAPALCETEMVRNYVAGLPPEVAEEKMKRWRGPSGRLCTPIEVAQTVLFLATDEARYISGVTIAVDGAFTAT